jgi:nitroreductase
MHTQPRPGTPSRGPEFQTLTLDRRRFLLLVGGTAAWTALRPALPWAELATARPGAPWTLPERFPTGTIEGSRALIGAALLAPSFWNTQPWRFEVDGDAIRVVLDPQRTMPVCDPDQRFALLSLGAALENMLVAARAWGQAPLVKYAPWGEPSQGARRGPFLAASLTWSPADARHDRLLFGALAERRTNGRRYDGRGITLQSRSRLLAQVLDDVRLHWIEERDVRRQVASLAAEATLERWRDRRAQAERFGWLRLSEGDARRRGDGVSVERLGVGGPARWFASHYFGPRSRFLRLGAESLAKETAEDVRSAGALALLTTARRGETSVITAGQAYERFSLTATALGVAHQPMTAPIESERHRAPLLRAFGAVGEEPLLLVRLGHADPPDPSPRRAAALVSTFRHS